MPTKTNDFTVIRFIWTLQVNGENIESFSHDQVIETLRSAGDIVTLTVKYFKPAALFLNKSSSVCKCH